MSESIVSRETGPVPVDGGLRTSASGAVFVGRPLPVSSCLDVDAARRRLSDSGLGYHMVATMSDLATSDVDERLLKPASDDRKTAMAPPGPPPSPQTGPAAARLAAQRSASISLLNSSARVRGAVLAKSCGDALLKRAAAGLVTRTPAGRSPVTVSRSRAGPPSQPSSSARVAGIRSSSSSSQLAADHDAGRRVPSYLALDDHRYTLRVPPPSTPQPPPSKVPKTGSRSSSGMRQSASYGNLVGVTSILEAFLRSSRPMDPNMGSNAALAAAGLSHLPLSRAATATTADQPVNDDDDDDDASGTLLKKLLTGKFDQSDVHRSLQPTSATVSNHQKTSGAVTSTVDSLLAEGFGLDGDLSLEDPQNMSLSLLDCVADDGLWITTHTDDFDDKVDISSM